MCGERGGEWEEGRGEEGEDNLHPRKSSPP